MGWWCGRCMKGLLLVLGCRRPGTHAFVPGFVNWPALTFAPFLSSLMPPAPAGARRGGDPRPSCVVPHSRHPPAVRPRQPGAGCRPHSCAARAHHLLPRHWRGPLHHPAGQRRQRLPLRALLIGCPCSLASTSARAAPAQCLSACSAAGQEAQRCGHSMSPAFAVCLSSALLHPLLSCDLHVTTRHVSHCCCLAR